MTNEPIVILGAGSTGEALVSALRTHEPDTPITVVERELAGGECSYFACMPTKGLLRPPEAVAAAHNVPGAAEAVTGPVDAARLFWHRDQIVNGLDDTPQAEWLASNDAQLVRGDGHVARPGIVMVGDRELPFGRLAVATGSSPSIPPIPGLDGVEYWTNREATQISEIPESIAIIGAGPVGCEFAQFFRRMGAAVAVVDQAERLLPSVDGEAGRMLADALEREGVVFHLGGGIDHVAPGRVALEGGAEIRAERLLIATGRHPRTEGLGLEQLGVEISKRGVEVDERMRAAPNVWAMGDVTGIAMFTHVGKYHARVAAADMAGRPAKADHRAVPAVTFTDPQVATVGKTTGEGLVSGSRRIDQVSRTSTYERPKRPGMLRVFADPERAVLVGAVAVGPEAGEWLGQLTLAVRAEVPLEVLRDTIQPYPTFSEAIQFAVRDLPL
jgi:pyruvate/2-oxoglutarate dehydrogenase complex dihydrolipoamide dehydrogenase (E3) component